MKNKRKNDQEQLYWRLICVCEYIIWGHNISLSRAKTTIPDMAVINHSIAYGGQNMIKLSIYVEFNNSMR